MAVNTDLTGTPLLSSRLPRTPGREATFTRAGLTLRPFVGPDILIVDESEEAFVSRYEIWRAQFNGSIPEFIVWEFLTLEKKLRHGFDFVFQHPLFGGRTRFGGFILDYFFNMKREGWRVQGKRFHVEQPTDRARDAIMQVQLEKQGIRIIDLFEDDLLTRKNFVLNLAFEQGVSVRSRAPV